MKKIYLLLVVAFFAYNEVHALRANAIWFLLAPTKTSVFNDSNINVTYHIFTKTQGSPTSRYAYGYNFPYPELKIEIENKTDKVIYIDLGTSYLKRNNVASPLYTPKTISNTTSAIGLNAPMGMGLFVGGGVNTSTVKTTYAERIISIPPHSVYIVENILIFTKESQRIFNNLFVFLETGALRTPYLFANRIRDTGHIYKRLIQHKQVMDFSEEKPLFRLGMYLTYSFDVNFETSNTLETTYYVKKLLGSKRTFEFSTMDKICPEWRNLLNNHKHLVIRLWTYFQ